MEFDHVCERSMERIVEASNDDQRIVSYEELDR